ncbi:hypothetical protein ACQP00_13180 [Dactylosporangium sp. CS-047395]|uniref:hypothetical protein n=1 Tax=Dactylosporangium sp. CS-047395 TaxID=3239936 RepID=UPI003D8F9E5E
MADISYTIAHQLVPVAAVALGVTATVIWSRRTAGTDLAADKPETATRVTGNGQVATIAAVAVAAIAIMLASPIHSLLPADLPFDWLAALTLLLAAALRGIRLSRPATRTFDRFTAALAIVPACALLLAVAYMGLYTGWDTTTRIVWAGGYLLAAALALTAGLRWRRTAG